jgi:molybdate transport system substrate-binding protein
VYVLRCGLVYALVTTLAGVACTNEGPTNGSNEVEVFAAASLRPAFTEMGEAFTAANSGIRVTFNFAGSSALVTQIDEGAPADVFASADTFTMGNSIRNGDAGGEPVVFATNSLQIVVEAGNPLGIAGVDDLADPGLVVVTCAPEVPCGRYAGQVFDKAGLTVTPKSLEENPNGVVAKVALGEADASVRRQRLGTAEQRLREGAFGDLLKALAPQLLPTTEILARAQSDLEAQRSVLELLARGETKPAMHANAGWYYQQAARATMRLPLNAQAAIEAIRASGDTPTTATVNEARRAINACRASVIDPIILASMSRRCSLPHHPTGASGSGLVRSCAEGINGSVRVVLADAFGAGGRPAGSPTRAEAAIACLRVAARFAGFGSYSHSLVAHQVMRDLKPALKQLESRGELTPEVRSELAAILAEMGESDPLGFEVATQSDINLFI